MRGDMHQVEQARVRSLAALARAVGRSAPLMDLLETAAEESLAAIGAASVSISRLEVGTGSVRTLINVGRLGANEQRWPEDEVYELASFANLRKVVDQGKPWTLSLADQDADPQEVALLHELGKGSAVGLPIVTGGQLWGEFYATRDIGSPAMGDDEIDFLDALTAILSGAVTRSEREETLARLAYHDPLTELSNRRMLDERAAQAFMVPDGVVRLVTAVMVDINGLKCVNDTCGHAVGDQLIMAVGASLQERFSRVAGSLVARVGGDEFVVLCVGHPPELVHQIADEVCGLTWTFGTPADVSCGAATFRLTSTSSETPHELFVAADRAQYVAKRARFRHTVLAGSSQVRVY